MRNMDLLAGASDRYGRWRLQRWSRNLSAVGLGLQLNGRPELLNNGKIEVGKDFFLSSRPVQSHILAMPTAVIDIGDRVRICYGAVISAQRSIRIGSGTTIGPFVIIMDGDYHRPGNRDAPGEITPICIGEGVSIGARVTILRGANIGADARVMSGSMVSGVVSRGAVVGGVPARIMHGSVATDVPAVNDLVRNVLGLADLPAFEAELKVIPEWDSLGTLRFLLAMEETYGVTVREDQIQRAKTVSDLARMIDQACETRIIDGK